MSKGDDDTPKVPKPQGPLGPWRLSIAVVISMVFTGLPLWRTAGTGVGLDMALLRSFGVAFITWIAVGKLSRVLVNPDQDDDDTDEVVDDATGTDDLRSMPG